MSVQQTEDNKIELQMDIAEIKNIEIMDVGSFIPMSGGKVDITTNDLDEIIKNFNEGVREPVLNLDHDDRLTDKVKKALKVVSLGFVSNLWRDNNKLKANFKEVPKKIASLIEGGALKKRSVEWFKDKFTANGKTYKNVLKAVSFFGAEAPAINTLSNEFEVIYDVLMQMDDYRKGEDETMFETLVFNKEKKMSKIEIDKSEYDELLSIKNKAELFKSKEDSFESFKAESDEVINQLKAENEELKDVKEELKKFKDTLEAEKADKLKADAETFVSDKVKEGKILSKYKDRYVSDYIRLSSDEGFESFKSEIEERPQLSQFKDHETGEMIEKDHISNGDLEIGGMKFKSDDHLNEYVEKQMAKNKTTFEEECAKIGI